MKSKTKKEKEDSVWRRKISFLGGEENGEGKVGKYLEKENILFVEEKKNGEGKGRKYLTKEREGNIWRRKISFLWREEKRTKKMRKYFEKENAFLWTGKRKMLFCGQGKGVKYLEKENIFLVKEETNGEEKGGNYFEKENQ